MAAQLDRVPGQARPVAGSAEELLGPDAVREPLHSDEAKSGARIERVRVGGDRYVLKHLDAEDDWIMRATGDLAGRPITLWRSGWFDELPDCIDHTIVAAAWDDDRPGGAGALLMRDVQEQLLPDGDHLIPMAEHLTFLDHMAQLHVAFWQRRDTVGLLPLSDRLVFFGPRLAETELARGGTDLVPTQLVPTGWERFAERAPRAATIVLPLLADPQPLVTALAATPQTLVHGDWKAGNLGRHGDGRTILLDWAIPGVAPPCLDLAYYLCLNRARLPHGKEQAQLAYRDALERHGIDTEPWWDRQAALCLLAIMLLFGWEKALGEGTDGDEELAWWEARVLEGASEL